MWSPAKTVNQTQTPIEKIKAGRAPLVPHITLELQEGRKKHIQPSQDKEAQQNVPELTHFRVLKM